MDVGYSCTATAVTFRETLAGIGRGSRVYGLMPLSEAEVARILVAMGNSRGAATKAAVAAAAAAGRPLTRRGRGRSVCLTTAVATDHNGQPQLRDSRSADTEVFYMAGRQLAALGRRLQRAAWPADTAVLVVSRAGCADQLISEHRLVGLAAAALLHSGRPTVVTVGVGAGAVSGLPRPGGACTTSGTTIEMTP